MLPRRALAFVLVVAIAGAAPAALAAGRSTRDQVDSIELDLRQLQIQVQEIREAQDAIRQSIADLRAALALDSPGRRTPADLAARLDSVETDLRILQENQNDSSQRVAVLSDKLDGIYRRQATMPVTPVTPTDVPVAGSPAEAMPPAVMPVDEEQVPLRAGGASVSAPAEPGSPPVATMATPEPLVDPEELYQAARADYGRGSYDAALAGFQEFLQRHPRSELADNALYWVGECHYSAGRLEDSIAAFDAVMAQFPDADKAPDAGYKKGLALLELGRTPEAIIQLQQVKDTWPSAPAGRLARTKLQSLGLL